MTFFFNLNILVQISINILNIMSINPTVKIALDDVVRYLLYQQFYYRGDRIYGRTKDQFEYIKTSGKAIEEFSAKNIEE